VSAPDAMPAEPVEARLTRAEAAAVVERRAAEEALARGLIDVGEYELRVGEAERASDVVRQERARIKDAARAEETRRQQDNEQARWYAKNPPRQAPPVFAISGPNPGPVQQRPVEIPAHLCEAVERERARGEAAAAAASARRAEDARRSWDEYRSTAPATFAD
jgi:hypothetical protein